MGNCFPGKLEGAEFEAAAPMCNQVWRNMPWAFWTVSLAEDVCPSSVISPVLETKVKSDREDTQYCSQSSTDIHSCTHKHTPKWLKFKNSFKSMNYLYSYFKNNGILITNKYAKIVITFSFSHNYKLKSIIVLSIHLLQWFQLKNLINQILAKMRRS